MADREWYPQGGTNGPFRVRVNFQFTTAGNANPAASSIKGASDIVASIVHSATGLYTVTLSARDSYNRIDWALASLEDTQSGGGLSARVGYVQNEGTASALTFQIGTYNTSNALTDVASARVWVDLVLRNTAIGGP